MQMLLSGNTTTIYDMNNIHSNRSDLCNSIITEIWAWAEGKKLCITPFYFPGKKNYDTESWKKTELEWILNNIFLQKLFLSFNSNHR